MKHFKLAMENDDLPLEVEVAVAMQNKERSDAPDDVEDVLDYTQELQRLQEANPEEPADDAPTEGETTDESPEGEAEDGAPADASADAGEETSVAEQAPEEDAQDADPEDDPVAMEANVVLHSGKKVTAKNLKSFPAGKLRDKAAHALMEKHSKQSQALHAGFDAVVELLSPLSIESAHTKADVFLMQAKALGYKTETVSFETVEADKRSVLTKVWEVIQKMLKRIKEMVMALVEWFSDLLKRVFGRSDKKLDRAAKAAKASVQALTQAKRADPETVETVLTKLSKITVGMPVALVGEQELNLEDFVAGLQSVPQDLSNINKWVAGPLFSLVKFSDFIRTATGGDNFLNDTEVSDDEFDNTIRNLFIQAISTAASNRKDFTAPGICLADTIKREYLFKNRLTDIVTDIIDNGHHNDPVVVARVDGKEATLDSENYRSQFTEMTEVSLGMDDADLSDYIKMADDIVDACVASQKQLNATDYLNASKIYSKNVDAFTAAMQKMINSSADGSGETLRRRAIAVVRGQEAANTTMTLFMRSVGKVLTTELGVVSAGVEALSNKVAGILGVAVGGVSNENFLDAVSDSDVDKLYELSEVNQDMSDVKAGLEALSQITTLRAKYGSKAKNTSMESFSEDFRDLNKTVRYYGLESFQADKFSHMSMESYSQRRTISMEADSWFATTGKKIIKFIQEAAKRIWAWLVGFFTSDRKHMAWSNAQARKAMAQREELLRKSDELNAKLAKLGEKEKAELAALISKFQEKGLMDNAFSVGLSQSPVLTARDHQKDIEDVISKLAGITAMYDNLVRFAKDKKTKLAIAGSDFASATVKQQPWSAAFKPAAGMTTTADFGEADFSYVKGLSLYKLSGIGQGLDFYITMVDAGLTPEEYLDFLLRHSNTVRADVRYETGKKANAAQVVLKDYVPGSDDKMFDPIFKSHQKLAAVREYFADRVSKEVQDLARVFSETLKKAENLREENLSADEIAELDRNIRIARADFDILQNLIDKPVTRIAKNFRELVQMGQAFLQDMNKAVARFNVEASKISADSGADAAQLG